MVGVAGKSQACNTCKERRVKCDLSRPSCLKCTKSNRACTGYSRNLIFVNRTPSDASSTATSVLSQIKAEQQSKRVGTDVDLLYLISFPTEKGRNFRHKCVQLLKTTYLPQQHISNSSNTNTSEGSFSWVYHLTDLKEPSKSLDTALSAFCLTQLYVTKSRSVSLYQCLDQYNAALQQLYSDLDDPQRQSQEETLAAVLILSTCELFICPAENGWGVHARGIVEILRLRDPEMRKTPAWRHLFSRLRVICTLEALTKRQAHLLESDLWQQNVADSSFNDALDEFYRMIADIPILLERAATLTSIDDRDVLLKESAAILQLILAKIKSVETWHDEFWRASPTPRAWLMSSCSSNPADDSSNKTFPSCFHFESLSTAVTVVMCWSVATQMYSNIIQIHDYVQAKLSCQIELQGLLAQANTNVLDAASTLAASSMMTVPFTQNKRHSRKDIENEGTRMVHKICQSMEYFHLIEMGTYGGHAITYPSWSARQYVQLHLGHEQKWAWLQNMHKMKGPGTRWGLSTMSFADVVEPKAVGGPRIT